MHKKPYVGDLALILIVFVLSRFFVYWAGVRMQEQILYTYWQYLDVRTLTHNLARGLWYDHAQPPFFNLLLGLVLKIFGSHSMLVFATGLKLISLANAFLLYRIVCEAGVGRLWGVLTAIAYAISPATLLFESELFYTGLISCLLLTSVLFLLKMRTHKGWSTALGFFIPIGILCLTRSMYHLVWLAIVAGVILVKNRKQPNFKQLLISSLLVIALVGSWYIKNLIIFNNFSASSWLGMNMARNVFHDQVISDSSRIEAIEPFSPLAMYQPFLKGKDFEKYRGLDDTDLLSPVKNDSINNLNHVAYLDISKQYGAANKAFIKTHPVQYLKNIVQSVFIFFTPATRYPRSERQVGKIKWFDLLYSFNLSHFAQGKAERRIALVVSAIPKLLFYLVVAFLFFRTALRDRSISDADLFIWMTIGFVFAVSSAFEHYENMRFRFEVEPLFLVIAVQVVSRLPFLKTWGVLNNPADSAIGRSA